MKRIAKETGAYILGFAVFVCLLPFVMWTAAGRPVPGTIGLAVWTLFAAAGIGLSVWTILYMRVVGKGNPFDAYGHELAPRTKHLMTEGPYAICRNPMMAGMLIYWIGEQLVLHSIRALIVFALILVAMSLQIWSEERRLARDFGDEYYEYSKRTYRFLPFRRKQ